MTQEGRLRIGIMGGTFDPIHMGHLILAECAYEQYHLDGILFLPSGNPPHKRERIDGASDEERLAMVSLAISGNPHFILENDEMEHEGYSYTYATLERLKSRHSDTDYYFIIGADSLQSFDTWRRPDIICKYCSLLAAVRDESPMEDLRRQAEKLSDQFGAKIFFLDTPNIDISSTDLRGRCRLNLSLRYYVPEPVRKYIEEKGIYKKVPAAKDDHYGKI